MPKTSRPVRCPPIGAEDDQGRQEILHFSLPGLLPPEHSLVFNTTLGTLSHLVIQDGRPSMIMEQQFTASEVYLLLPLLQSFPYYCPHEVLFASFTTGQWTETAVNKARELLQEASLEPGMWDQQMKRVRNGLSRMRFKTRQFGMEVTSIPETGYILMKKPPKRRYVE